MDKLKPRALRTVSAILNILAGVLFLGAGINIFGATPGPSWMWFIFSAFFLGTGIWNLFG
jgi:hypothetical protein